MKSRKYRLRFLSIAEEDFTDIISYIAGENKDAANELANLIEENLNLLIENPFMGRVPRDEDLKSLGYRFLIVKNYLIFYSIESDVIIIKRILHGARNYKDIL